jgi:hypothetical protein
MVHENTASETSKAIVTTTNMDSVEHLSLHINLDDKRRPNHRSSNKEQNASIEELRAVLPHII